MAGRLFRVRHDFSTSMDRCTREVTARVLRLFMRGETSATRAIQERPARAMEVTPPRAPPPERVRDSLNYTATYRGVDKEPRDNTLQKGYRGIEHRQRRATGRGRYAQPHVARAQWLDCDQQQHGR